MNDLILQQINNELINDKLSHTFLFNVDDNYTIDYIYEIIKKILIQNSDDSNNYFEDIDLIKSESYNDIKIIRPEGKSIKKEQIIELIKEFEKKSISNNYRFYIIEYAEDLNESSANTLLKFLEEPEEKIIAILISKNIHKVIPTIVSRCQIINLNFYEKKAIETSKINVYLDYFITFNQYKKNSSSHLLEVYNYKSDELIDLFSTFISFYEDYLNVKTRKNFNSNYFSEEQIKLIDKTIENELFIVDVIKRLEYCIFLLKGNVNTRIVLDRLIIGGDYIYE